MTESTISRELTSRLDLRRTAIASVLALAMLGPATVFAEDPEVGSVEVATDDGGAVVSVGLDAQVRYTVEEESGEDPAGAFRIRRLRPILGFEGFSQFEVKVVPEFAGEPELKDGVIRWIPVDWFKLEGGQFAPPFNWERDGSSDYHQFTERTVANSEFQIADGRDIGMQVDFEWDKWLDFEAGVFNGAGSNTLPAPGRGPVLAGRLAWAPFGYYHEVEVIPELRPENVFVAAIGGYYAFRNGWRDWAPPGISAEDELPADVASITADAHL